VLLALAPAAAAAPVLPGWRTPCCVSPASESSAGHRSWGAWQGNSWLIMVGYQARAQPRAHTSLFSFSTEVRVRKVMSELRRIVPTPEA
jgi:hypothetical protein